MPNRLWIFSEVVEHDVNSHQHSAFKHGPHSINSPNNHYNVAVNYLPEPTTAYLMSRKTQVHLVEQGLVKNGTP